MKAVKIWLWIGIIMTLIQVMLGGITRLTGSGLSITEWDVIMGAMPPSNTQEWNEAFEKYKAFPQYQLVNKNMNLEGFKRIFFWEYLHRNWARLIGLVFIFPFIIFLFQKKLNRSWKIKLSLLLLLGALQGLMGWVMVASGLIDKPWVSPYNLTLHLLLALAVFIYLLWLVFSLHTKRIESSHPTIHKQIKPVLTLVILQIIFGGFMAGTKAGIVSPTYPLMDGKFFPDNFFLFDSLLANIFENQTAINFIHRTLAIIVALSIILLVIKNYQFASQQIRKLLLCLALMISLQFILGVCTLLSGKQGEISVLLGTLHQSGAFILTGICIALLYFSLPRNASLLNHHNEISTQL